ncbi:MAG: UDP-N-acetylglucosamine 1-carboxyvinyltransferase [Deltaproteobacteria bacterium]|nr:UDP-N-acetylglucosamine 1-carboxyvinyltransferase [Deltaproteobacteria bacterium]
MDKLIIHGGNPLHGEVQISGAKNAAQPLMTAALLAPGTSSFANIPNLRDIDTMLALLKHLGVTVSRENGTLHLSADNIRADDAPYDLVRTMRASVLVMGPLVGRLRHAKVSLPGGCAIGARPINLHLKALEQMGCTITLHDGYVEVDGTHLQGAHVVFDGVTVTGTENIMMAAVLAPGTTILDHAAREPEVVDLANFLTRMGANIKGAGTDRIEIQGVASLTPASYEVMPDRIEAGTFMIAAAITSGDITLRSCPIDALTLFTAKLREAGAIIDIDANKVRVRGPRRSKAVSITTAPQPGFATDLQAQFMALMTIAEGTSTITETIFENRFMHVPELHRLGANITIDGSLAIVRGIPQLTGAPVMATDLRASASLVLAGLAAHGTTELRRIYHLDRGYEAMEQKLKRLGANIERVRDKPS